MSNPSAQLEQGYVATITTFVSNSIIFIYSLLRSFFSKPSPENQPIPPQNSGYRNSPRFSYGAFPSTSGVSGVPNPNSIRTAPKSVRSGGSRNVRNQDYIDGAQQRLLRPRASFDEEEYDHIDADETTDLHSQISNLHRKVSELKEEKQELQKQIEGREEQMVKLEEERDRFSRMAMELDSSLISAGAEIEILQDRIAKTESSLRATRSEKAALENRYFQLTRDHKELEFRIHNLQQRFEKSEAARKVAQEELAALRALGTMDDAGDVAGVIEKLENINSDLDEICFNLSEALEEDLNGLQFQGFEGFFEELMRGVEGLEVLKEIAHYCRDLDPETFEEIDFPSFISYSLQILMVSVIYEKIFKPFKPYILDDRNEITLIEVLAETIKNREPQERSSQWRSITYLSLPCKSNDEISDCLFSDFSNLASILFQKLLEHARGSNKLDHSECETILEASRRALDNSKTQIISLVQSSLKWQHDVRTSYFSNDFQVFLPSITSSISVFSSNNMKFHEDLDSKTKKRLKKGEVTVGWISPLMFGLESACNSKVQGGRGFRREHTVDLEATVLSEIWLRDAREVSPDPPSEPVKQLVLETAHPQETPTNLYDPIPPVHITGDSQVHPEGPSPEFIPDQNAEPTQSLSSEFSRESVIEPSESLFDENLPGATEITEPVVNGAEEVTVGNGGQNQDAAEVVSEQNAEEKLTEEIIEEPTESPQITESKTEEVSEAPAEEVVETTEASAQATKSDTLEHSEVTVEGNVETPEVFAQSTEPNAEEHSEVAAEDVETREVVGEANELETEETSEATVEENFETQEVIAQPTEEHSETAVEGVEALKAVGQVAELKAEETSEATVEENVETQEVTAQPTEEHSETAAEESAEAPKAVTQPTESNTEIPLGTTSEEASSNHSEEISNRETPATSSTDSVEETSVAKSEPVPEQTSESGDTPKEHVGDKVEEESQDSQDSQDEPFEKIRKEDIEGAEEAAN